MTPLAALQRALRDRRDRRRRQERLRRELGEFRTPAERQELGDICARYGVTVEELLAGRPPPALAPVTDRPAWEDDWDEIVLYLDLDDPADGA